MNHHILIHSITKKALLKFIENKNKHFTRFIGEAI